MTALELFENVNLKSLNSFNKTPSAPKIWCSSHPAHQPNQFLPSNHRLRDVLHTTQPWHPTQTMAPWEGTRPRHRLRPRQKTTSSRSAPRMTAALSRSRSVGTPAHASRVAHARSAATSSRERHAETAAGIMSRYVIRGSYRYSFKTARCFFFEKLTTTQCVVQESRRRK